MHAGRAILSGDLAHAFDDSAVQTGPLALIWAALLALVLHVLHASPTVGYMMTMVASLTPTLYAVTLWASRHTPPRWLFVAAAGILILLLVPWQLSSSIAYQHPTYLWVPALWLLAAAAACRARPVATALLLVMVCGLETWAVLVAPVLVPGLPPWRDRVRACAIWAVATATLWAPWVLSDQFRMLDKTWPSGIETPIDLDRGSAAIITCRSA